MVVGYDYLRALLLDILDLVRARNSAVDRYEKLGKVFLENFVDCGLVQSVTVAAFGNVDHGLDAEVLQDVAHYGGRADAVRVVVAVDDDNPVLVAGAGYQSDRFVHSAHFKGRNEVGARRIDKFLYLFLIVHAPPEKNFNGVLHQPRFGGKLFYDIQLFVRKFVFGNNSFHF